MKIHIKGRGESELKENSFIASGGESKVYAKGSTAYKIYHDPSKMIAVAKIKELAALTNDNIIKPQDIILDTNNKEIGYTMRYVKDTLALCSIFTKAFRERNKITPDVMFDLVRELQNLIKHVHQNKILCVDLNELNFLVDKTFKEIYAIDVDSYQTPNFRATALMESVRDRHSNSFNEGTDWFAFAITSFQMMTSIHPYKGKHDKLKSLDERMIKNISVLNKDVSVPAVVYPFSNIPEIYLNWYKAVLESGKRIAPPEDLNAVIKLITEVKKVIGSNLFNIKELKTFNSNILDVIYSGNHEIILSSDELYIGVDRLKILSNDIHFSITPKTNNVIAGYIENNNLKLLNTSNRSYLSFSLLSNDIMSYQDRIYCKSLDKIIEIQLNEFGQNIIPSSKIVATVLENSSKLYKGVVVQNLLGTYYISLFPSGGVSYQLKIPELDKNKIIDAQFQNNVLMIIAVDKSGKYNKLIMRFSEKYDSYDLRIINDCTHLGFNFVVLDNGVCVHLLEEGKLELFSNKKDSASIKVVEDKVLTSDMKLYKNGTKILFAKENKLYSISMV